MEKETILLIHSILGAIVFATGVFQFILKKGGKLHSYLGYIYVYAWLFLLISGAYLGGLLITIIGIFGYYFALTGARIGYLKTKSVTFFEKMIFILGTLIAIVMLFYSLKLFAKGENSYSIIFGIFGCIFLFQTVQDISKYLLNKPLKKQVYGKSDWYFEHFTRMCISFIAAVTAFTSIQNLFNNNTLNFLMPTFLGIILINILIKYYKNKFKIT